MLPVSHTPLLRKIALVSFIPIHEGLAGNINSRFMQVTPLGSNTMPCAACVVGWKQEEVRLLDINTTALRTTEWTKKDWILSGTAAWHSSIVRALVHHGLSTIYAA